MIIRACRPDDFVPIMHILDAAADADHTRHLREDSFRNDFFSGYDNTPLERAFVAVNDNSITGFIWWETVDSTFAIQGWVHPARRGQGIGTALLCAVENYARKIGGSDKLLVARTYADLDGSVRLFNRQGYDEVRRFNLMKTSLIDQHYSVDIPAGIRLETFSEQYLVQLVEADNAIFASHFGSHPRTTAQWRHQMMEMRPYDPSLWVIAWYREQIIGECLCNISQQGEANDGWVSIVGVRGAWRGRGVAQAVLAEGLRRLQQAGFVSAALHVDSENIPAVRLYQHLGLSVERISLHFHKHLFS